jgi:hypothetical protein
MEKIKILKTELTSLGFNVNIYVDMLLHIDKLIGESGLAFDQIEAWGSAELFQIIIRDRQLFTFNAKDIFVIRQLLVTGYFAVDQTNEENKDAEPQNLSYAAVAKPSRELELADARLRNENIKIRLDRISLGTHHNIPANKDITVDKIASNPYYKFHIPEKLDEKQLRILLAKSEMLYDIDLAKPFIDGSSQSDSIKLIKCNSFKYENGNENAITPNPYFNVGPLNKYFSKYLYCNPTNSFDIFISRLYHGGLLEILRELINKQEPKMEKMMFRIEKLKSAKKLAASIYEKLYEQTNLFNRLANIMMKSPKSYETILEKITSLKITNHRTLMEVVSKADRDKIKKLVEVGLPIINNCSHNNAFKQFYSARNRDDKMESLDKLQDEYVRHDVQDHVFRCKKCDQFLYCEHTIEFINASTVGLAIPSETKSKLAGKYRDPMINDINGTTFCKYCGEKIHRFENDEIIDGNIFNAMSHARSLDSENGTELPVIKNQSYIAIKKVLESFIFRYEYNRVSLIKDIQNIILYHIINDISTLRIKFEDEHFEGYAQLISAIYTYIYMMNLYNRDPNILFKDVRAGAKLSINEYAGEFANRIIQQYRFVTNDVERISKMIKNAYVTMKDEVRSDINVVTESDIATYIISDPYYKFLYYLYSIEFRKTNGDKKPVPNEVDAFSQIVKANPMKESFLVKSYAPTNPMWKTGANQILANIYDITLNFASPYNDVQIKYPNLSDLSYLPGYQPMEYDPRLRNQNIAMIEKRNYENRRLIYRDLLFNNEIHEIFSLMPACLVFDDQLKMYNWQPVIENRVAVDYSSGDAKLSKLKCDDAKSDLLILKLSPDKLTKPKGKFRMEKSSKVKQDVAKHQDIQFSVIKKIIQSASVNQLKFIGLSGGVTSIEFNKGNVMLPIEYELGSLKLESYVKYFVRKYNELRFNANRSDKLKLFEQSGLLNKVGDYMPEKFPDIGASEFFKKIDNLTSFENKYTQLQAYLVDVINILLKSGDPIFRLFTVETMMQIFNIDKTYCISETYIASSDDTVIDDEDAIGNNDQIEDVDENDDGFVDLDNIDYEEDVDEEHDPS